MKKEQIYDILKHVDHTQLSVRAKREDIEKLCKEAMRYNTASVCIPPCYVKYAHDILSGIVPVCTVVGFPNGYSTPKSKAFETEEALKNGAEEIDIVISLCDVANGDFDAVLEEIKLLKAVCGNNILKVIVETAMLEEAEKIRLCEVVAMGGADYIKTSTGFKGGGATREDVALLRKYSPEKLKVKAAGGIASLEDALDFISLGADRLGTSRLVSFAEEVLDD